MSSSSKTLENNDVTICRSFSYFIRNSRTFREEILFLRYSRQRNVAFLITSIIQTSRSCDGVRSYETRRTRAYKTSPQLRARSIQARSDASSEIGSSCLAQIRGRFNPFPYVILSRFVELHKRGRNVSQLLA